jgi:hypothetical protein
VVAVQVVTLGKHAEALKLDTISTLMTSDIIGKKSGYSQHILSTGEKPVPVPLCPHKSHMD